MIWSFSVPPTRARDFAGAADKVLDENRPNIQKWNPPGEDQAERAVEAAKLLVESGVVGGPHFLVSASLSGHGNPRHVPAEGWSEDTIHITVSQQRE